MAFQIGQGLAALHKKGIIHRDMKPQNVLLTEDNIARLSDMGLCKRLTNEQSYAESSTIGAAAGLSMLTSACLRACLGAHPAPVPDHHCKHAHVCELSSIALGQPHLANKPRYAEREGQHSASPTAAAAAICRSNTLLHGPHHPKAVYAYHSDATLPCCAGGSSGWQAPEQLLQLRGLVAQQGRRLDVFSFGLVLYWLLAGGAHPYGQSFERDYNILQVTTWKPCCVIQARTWASAEGDLWRPGA